MSAPAPRIVNVVSPRIDDPVWPVAPTSWLCHGLGRFELDVANDQTGPVVDPAPLVATICQKYVVFEVSVPGEYDGPLVLAPVDGGGFVVPKLIA